MPPLKEAPHRPEVVGSSIRIKGVVVSGEDLYFDGEVDGSIEAIRSTVTVGPNAKVAASIRAQNVIVFGNALGSIEALGSVELRKNCELMGDVVTSRIIIEDGASFKGSVNIWGRKDQTPGISKDAALEERYSKMVSLK